MSVKCYICNYYDPKRMSLFRIPNRSDEYSERAKVWVKLLEAKNENVDKIRICSHHFLKKKPSKADNYLDMDWVPNQNLGKYSKNWKGVEYYIRKKNAKRHVENNDIQFNVRPNSGHVQQDVQPKSKINKEITKYEFEGTSSVFVNDSKASTSLTVSVPDLKVSSFTNANQETVEEKLNCTMIDATCRLNMNSLIPLKKRKIIVTDEIRFSPKEIQTELTMDDIDLLFEYYQRTVDERDELLLKVSTLRIDFDYFKENDKKTRFFTGFPNWKLLNRFFDLVKNFIPTHFNCKLSKFQMVVLTLMKLRLNANFTDLGYRFQIAGNTASTTFHRCLYILFKKFKNTKIVHWPEENSLIFSTPSYFRSTLKDIVTVILDCFEIFTERPSMLRAAAQLFSYYKHHPTLKILIGISMSGAIIFISKVFGGRTSDKEATKQSGLLNLLKEGDCVLADKGFLIREEVNAKNAELKMPCFVNNREQLHPIELENSRKNSSLRIHVERVINILRKKFTICSDIAKISALSKRDEIFEADVYDMIIFLCACFVNMCPSVVTSDFEM